MRRNWLSSCEDKLELWTLQREEQIVEKVIDGKYKSRTLQMMINSPQEQSNRPNSHLNV